MPAKRIKVLFFLGLLAIGLIYTLYNVWLVDVYYYRSMPPWIKFGNKLVVIIMVYGIGWYVLKRITVAWMIRIWHMVYFTITSILVVIAALQWKFHIETVQLTNIVHTLIDLLISPLLYLCMGIIQYRISIAR